MTGFDISPFANYIWAAVIIGSILAGLKIIFNSSLMKAITKEKAARKTNIIKPKSIIDKIRNTIQDPDSALAELDKHIADQKARGVTEDQMQMMIQEREMILKYAKNEWVQLAAEPLLNKAKEVAAGFGLKL